MNSYKFYYNAETLPEQWDALPISDIFLKSKYLKGLEEATSGIITPYYLGIYNNETLIGKAIIQRVVLSPEVIYREGKDTAMKCSLKALITKIISGTILVVGNMMLTGEHGFYFDSKRMTQDAFLELLNKATDTLKVDIKKTFKTRVKMVVLKDYFTDNNLLKSSFFNKNNFHAFQVQPNMILSVSDDWKHPDDYLAVLHKKYRQRYRSARKKVANFEHKELDLKAIETHSETLYSLYETVCNNAKVNTFILSKNHFYDLKNKLQNDFKVFGYFLNDELVGFYTLILNGEELETYFLGYRKEVQREYKIYMNMLYDMLCYGIENNFKKVIYARTALEIKSTVGAKPFPMVVFLKYSNAFIANLFLKLIVKYMNPVTEWQERHPFK